MTTLREISQCRSRHRRVGMALEWLIEHDTRIEIGDGMMPCLWVDRQYEGPIGPRLDTLLLAACRRVEKELKK